MLTLRGRGAILVGTKRVGGVVAHRLAREGVNLAIVYRSSRQEAERLNGEVAGLTERTALIGGDLSDEDDVKGIVRSAKDSLGDLSFVVNLAAGFPRNPFETLDGAAWDASMSFAKGNYLLNVHAARVMMENEGPTRGHIVQFSDWAAWETPYKNYLPYLTAKGGHRLHDEELRGRARRRGDTRERHRAGADDAPAGNQRVVVAERRAGQDAAEAGVIAPRHGGDHREPAFRRVDHGPGDPRRFRDGTSPGRAWSEGAVHMPTYSVTKTIGFCYGHRLIGHKGKCRHLHGHNGLVEIEVEAEKLDELGVVMDFSDIRDAVKGWIDSNLDHRMILNREDEAVPMLQKLGEPMYLIDENPTAENITRLIYGQARDMGIDVKEVRLWETPSSYAAYRE